MTREIDTRLLGRDVSYDLAEPWLAYWMVLMRFAVGWWLLHAGLDKLFNWPFEAGWFLERATGTSLGPVVTLFDSGVLLTFVDWSIPIGQFLIGLGLILGALTRTAAFFGAFLLTFFYFINGEGGDWAHGVITGEFLGIVICGMIITLGAGKVFGVDAYLLETDFVENHPRLQYLLS